MPPALLAGHCSLYVTSSKPLEVQSTVSALLGSQAILEQRDGIGREQEVGDLVQVLLGITDWTQVAFGLVFQIIK